MVGAAGLLSGGTGFGADTASEYPFAEHKFSGVKTIGTLQWKEGTTKVSYRYNSTSYSTEVYRISVFLWLCF